MTFLEELKQLKGIVWEIWKMFRRLYKDGIGTTIKIGVEKEDKK